MTKLTPKQKAFIDEYLIDLNATQAAIRAGYSAKTAESRGSQLLRNIKVAEAVAKGQQERSQRTLTDADWVITQLVGNHKLALQNDELGHSNKALELIGKHHGAFVDRVETSGAITVTIVKPGAKANK